MRIVIGAMLFALSLLARAGDLQISQPLLYTEGKIAYAVLNVSWDNAWNNDKNNDAVWLFFKSQSTHGAYQHIKINSKGHEIVSVFSNNPDLKIVVPKDGTGLFLEPGSAFRGEISATIKIVLNRESFKTVDPTNWLLTAYGIEMVKIPQGSFELGDTDSTARAYGAFYNPRAEDEVTGLISINSEDQKLNVGPKAALYYLAGEEKYEGDQKGLIPASFPKGVAPFYIMKYEPSEGQYAAFLNSLSESQVKKRININEKDYQALGGSIKFEDGQYSSEFPNKPCMFMGWDDAMAYADWAGLRPMTEFEFVKASRGPTQPVGKDFPWGDNRKEKMQRLPGSHRTLEMVNGWEESRLSEDSKAQFGASYYWVMDLAGSLWERVITIGHPKGRSYIGLHGDGTITVDGDANVENWPKAEDAGGIGFRGGGFYGYDREYHDFNPFSPVAYRRFGGWHGAMRNNAYSCRFVRTAEK